MRYILFLFAFCLLFSCSNKEEPLVKTEKVSGTTLRSTFKVWGNCDMCKETIEGSLKNEAISAADWNTETKLITVTYDSTEVNLDAIEKNIAAAGYDNVKYKGDDAAYASLPDCCKYERK